MKLLVLACVISVGLCMPGGWRKQDPTDQRWEDMLMDLNDQNKLGLLTLPQSYKIVGVSTQLVSGMNYNFTLNIGGNICSFVYYEQPWTNTHEITSDRCNVKMSPPTSCPGCPQPQSVTDPKWMTQLNSILSLPANGVQINSVKTQVVAGIKYIYDLTVAGQHCEVEYVEQAWSNTHQVVKDTCHLAKSHVRQLAGGYQPQNPKDPKWRSMLTQMAQDNLIMLGANDVWKVLHVDTQVVSGMNYRFTLSVNGHHCTLVYYEQPWTQTKEVSEDTCGLKVTRRQLGGNLLGGWRDVTDKSDAGLQECMAASLDRVNLMSNSMYRMVETNVKAQVKTVAGLAYKIHFTVAQSSCMNNAQSSGFTAQRCPADASGLMSSTWESDCWYRAWLQGDDRLQLTSVHMV